IAAVHLIKACAALGRQSTTTMPAIGMKVMYVSMWSICAPNQMPDNRPLRFQTPDYSLCLSVVCCLIVYRLLSLFSHQPRHHDDDHAHDDHVEVAVDAAGLQLAEAVAHAHRQVGEAVHQAVDDVVVEQAVQPGYEAAGGGDAVDEEVDHI